MKKIIIFIIMYVMALAAIAQEDSTMVRPAQVTFFYPLGTNGTSTAYTNNFSFNILYGVNNGVNGAEIGGLVNSNLGHVNGLQIAGLANMNAKAANGMLIAGIGNFVKDTSNSLAFAGISNVIGGNAFGAHVAGISNTVNGDFLGGQVSGIVNVVNGNTNGIQVAGITNVSAGDMQGGQVSGISNIVKGDLSGAQIGLINRAANVKGFQLGLINIADSVSGGVPLGLFSFVKKGYHSLELEVGEAIYANANFKMGVDRLYTIYKFGYTMNGANQYWSYGLGLGSKINVAKNLDMSFDLTGNHIVKQTFNPNVDLLAKFDLKLRYNIGKHFTVFAGPSVNGYFSEHDIDTETSALKVPYSIHTWNWWNDEGQSYLWIGGNAGVAVNF
ncbi:hypothetical protein K6119_15235 [Paracrocinitomix mangrovi]|uniref:hypothetical protein n=1 Tax=Paracrocinitomix mangrovi TaxID=2862509 RepID=UPI001C8DE3DD|nr:hypothetical protein [Paracrocinitomix mangrovi]UKN01083.1 hypothetical protein K6119_15235 [Paracrocinitomix mangrovi]